MVGELLLQPQQPSFTAAAVSAHDAVDRLHGDAGFRDVAHGTTHTAPQVAEFWRAVEQDARFLEEGTGRPIPAPQVAEFWRAVEQDARFLEEGTGRTGDPISEGDMEVARIPSHAERGR